MISCTELCQLASSWSGAVPAGGYACEEKKDGHRALCYRGHDGQPRLWSRNGMPINGVEHIIYRLSQFERVSGAPLVVDGEFVVGNSLAETKRWVEAGWKSGGTAGVFYAFDVLPLTEWHRGGWDKPWHERKRWLVELAQAVNEDPTFAWDWRPGSFGEDEGRASVGILMDTWAFDAADVLDEARRVWAAGGEGIMCKDPEAPYERRRTNSWLKVKCPSQFARCF